jgi:hypothetical protein
MRQTLVISAPQEALVVTDLGDGSYRVTANKATTECSLKDVAGKIAEMAKGGEVKIEEFGS